MGASLAVYPAKTRRLLQSQVQSLFRSDLGLIAERPSTTLVVPGEMPVPRFMARERLVYTSLTKRLCRTRDLPHGYIGRSSWVGSAGLPPQKCVCRSGPWLRQAGRRATERQRQSYSSTYAHQLHPQHLHVAETTQRWAQKPMPKSYERRHMNARENLSFIISCSCPSLRSCGGRVAHTHLFSPRIMHANGRKAARHETQKRRSSPVKARVCCHAQGTRGC